LILQDVMVDLRRMLTSLDFSV